MSESLPSPGDGQKPNWVQFNDKDHTNGPNIKDNPSVPDAENQTEEVASARNPSESPVKEKQKTTNWVKFEEVSSANSEQSHNNDNKPQSMCPIEANVVSNNTALHAKNSSGRNSPVAKTYNTVRYVKLL